MSEPSNPTSASASSPDLLAGTAERDAAEARLRQATGAGVLDLEEFAQRMEVLLRARTRGEVERVVADLPATTAGPPASRRPQRRWIVAIMGGEETSGRWRPAPKTTALAVMGGVEVDLREAELDDVVLDAIAVMGGVEVIVPEGVAVEVRGFAFMGGREVSAVQPESPDAPVVVVNAYAVMGGVEVRNPGKRDRPAAVHRSHTPAVHRPQPPAVRQPRRWFGKALAAAAIAWFALPLWTGGPISVFGGDVHTVTAAEAAQGETVNARTAFGSVEVVVPDDVAVQSSGLVIFGSNGCEACEDTIDPDAPVVRVRAFGAFGSIDVVRASDVRREP